MLKIGDFSRAAHVTVKALRHYGRMGLLHPAWVDRFSGYRYYSIEQLSRLNRILALKELGFSLEQIGDLLDHPLRVDDLRSILQQKRVELEERLQVEQARLVQVGLHLEQIEQAGGWDRYEVVLKNVPEQAVVSVREVVPDARLAAVRIKQMRRRAVEKMHEHGYRLAGTWITISHNREYTDRNLDLEVAVVLEAAAIGAGGKQRGRNPLWQSLPAAPQMACVVVSGGVHELPQAYGVLYTWIEANGWQTSGVVREVCHADPETDQVNCPVIEVQIPVERPLLSKTKPEENEIQKESTMEPKFVTKPAFMLVGMKYVGKNPNNEIAQMWGRFSPFIAPLARQPMEATYGWCGMLKDPPEEGAFEYLAAVEADHAENLPDWAVVRMIPELTYAVFPHVGPLETLRQTYHYVYTQWMPQSGFESGAPFDMEVYTDEFKDFAPDSVMYLYFPVKKKA